MGRLFDAAAAIFGIRERNGYEGECPIALENAAASALAKGKEPYPFRFRITQGENGRLTADQADFARQLIHASESGADAESAALGFHLAIAEMAENICLKIRERTGENRVALSGGVFANLLLSNECFNRLEKDGFKVYTNQIVPSNDGGISLGQAWICARLQNG
jgi:hydrogenase maturation protein HypF